MNMIMILDSVTGLNPAIKSLSYVLHSEFFNIVLGVYDHIYSSNSNSESEDQRANYASRATIAAFAACDGLSHPRYVELEKSVTEGLGFNILGGQEQSSPVFISRILPGGVADKHNYLNKGRGLKRGDMIVSINGLNVEGETHEKVVELLKASKGLVKLVVCYAPYLLEQVERRFSK